MVSKWTKSGWEFAGWVLRVQGDDMMKWDGTSYMHCDGFC